MQTSLELSDFTFVRLSYEVWAVTYKNPKTGTCYKSIITEPTIIDLTKNSTNDLQLIDMLKVLKFICESAILLKTK